MGQIELTVDGRTLRVAAGTTLLGAADAVGVYVPRLCAHPGLRTAGHCGVCAVEVEGAGVVQACETAATAGARVTTDGEVVRAARAAALNRLLAVHPHACLTCVLREGCGRSQCSRGNPEEARCCEKFDACEFRQVASFLGIPEDAPEYVPRGLPSSDEGLYVRNLNLCIGCLRCEDACRDLAGVEALEKRTLGESLVVGPASGGTMKEAGCVFCGACLQVCPTGALMAKKDEEGRRWLDRTREKLGLEAVPVPPRVTLVLDAATVDEVPAAEGVYQLYDSSAKVVKIKGVVDLRSALGEEVAQGVARSFTWEQASLFTSRESQLIQQHLARHGSLPDGDDLEDLF